MPKNILFIMSDQLRFDYLGCTGHPHIRTPHIDALAARGIRFDRAYVQSPICGPSRMSTYTGRYPRSHGSTWNGVPLRVGEWTMGDHLDELGMRTVLCGKTHMRADLEGMRRLGLDPASGIGARVAECGFEIWDRLDGLHPDPVPEPAPYADYLRGLGYGGPNPWEQWANSAEGDEGEILSGWLMEHADKPARIRNEDSETPYTTTRAMEFIAGAGDDPWCLHLSYIKPHWPYIVPAPYHDMYGPEHVLPAVRSQAELSDAHPVLAAYHQHRFSKVFAREEVRQRVIPAYMGLITQLDDQIGRLMDWLEETGRSDETLIVFTSDHGDYLGDHWLGEKEMFHDPSVRVPLIVVDPSPEADVTRGTVSEALVEAIDLLPTFVEVAGGAPKPHVLEGASLLPLVRRQDVPWRGHVISEYDYSSRRAQAILDQSPQDCRLIMVHDGRWKYVHAEGFRPMLYDLKSDPDELHDLGADPTHESECARLGEVLNRWARHPHSRITAPYDAQTGSGAEELELGILIGFWDSHDVDEATRNGESGN
ncbi:phosphonate monoester hydrolase [Roseovarius faecimaris]|uniref:Phosphonate monoester hydrolase n=1 Tax=Roseovarius faecimaris TaxID=2494550 RepID=A0A6I6IIU8_9RHOB|nr:alkaline phosphatase family protein [Roseovarius faecimaris]QGX96850.1 phosphonate monoester hydrolase [Roseovarius faecimaris]